MDSWKNYMQCWKVQTNLIKKHTYNGFNNAIKFSDGDVHVYITVCRYPSFWTIQIPQTKPPIPDGNFDCSNLLNQSFYLNTRSYAVISIHQSAICCVSYFSLTHSHPRLHHKNQLGKICGLFFLLNAVSQLVGPWWMNNIIRSSNQVLVCHLNPRSIRRQIQQTMYLIWWVLSAWFFHVFSSRSSDFGTIIFKWLITTKNTITN